MDRVKILELSLSALTRLLIVGSEHHFRVVQGIPKGATILAIRPTNIQDRFEALLQSEYFDPVLPGTPIPKHVEVIIQDLPLSKRDTLEQ